MAIPGDGIADAPSERREGKGNAVVNEARRLLMRLATQLNSHALDLARFAPRALTASSPVDLTKLAGRGAREPDAVPHAPGVLCVVLPHVVQSDADAGSGPLTPHCSVSADQSRLIEDFAVFVKTAPIRLPVPELAHPVLAPVSVASFPVAVDPAGGIVADATLTKLPEKTQTLKLPMAPPEFVRLPKSARRTYAMLIAEPKVRAIPERVANQVALERRRASLPSPESLAGRNIHLMTRQMLAKAAGAGVTEDDITIVGIYRKVPLSAATKMAFDEETNALCLTLRPDAARVVQSQRQQQVVSLVFGRVRSDGRLVRALVPTPAVR